MPFPLQQFAVLIQRETLVMAHQHVRFKAADVSSNADNDQQAGAAQEMFTPATLPSTMGITATTPRFRAPMKVITQHLVMKSLVGLPGR